MSRKVCITAVDGQTGYLIAELLLTNPDFSKQVDAVACLALDPDNPKCKELEKQGATIVPHKFGRVKEMAKALKQTGADTICVVPPTHSDKFDITMELVQAAKQAEVQNVCLISAAGADLADPNKQPRLHEFLDIENEVLATKGDPDVKLGHSPVVIRAGFYAENLLLYSPQAKEEGVLPLPIGKNHKFAPIALGDVALVAAHVLSGKGEHGFDDKHRGQLIVLTGPMLAAGEELATAASEALEVEMKFEDISVAEAKKLLKAQSDADESEKQYILDYYSLVKEGKTNYISTIAFNAITGQSPQELTEFFKIYSEEFLPHHPNKKRKTNSK